MGRPTSERWVYLDIGEVYVELTDECEGLADLSRLIATLPEPDDEIGELIAALPHVAGALVRAEAFIAGFEGDPLQDGIADLLRDIRRALKAAGYAPLNSPKPTADAAAS